MLDTARFKIVSHEYTTFRDLALLRFEVSDCPSRALGGGGGSGPF